MSNTRVGIIGAGPAGLTAGYLLTKAGFDVDVWEADPVYVGGISRTVVYKGFRFDIGGHRFFSKSEEVEDLWTEILPDDFIVRNRKSRILYRQKFYSYPLDAQEVLRNLGKRLSFLSVASYAKAKLLASRTPTNLEDWVTLKFGGRLYHMFFKTYTEKVWGMPCREISADWAAQRIKGLSLSRAARRALRPSRPPGISPGKRSAVIKTLITSFRYPRLGPGQLWEAAVDKIRAQGGRVTLASDVVAVERQADQDRWALTVRHDGREAVHTYDHVISSAPLGWLVNTLRPLLPDLARQAAASLSYRDFIQVALILKPRIDFPDNWLYVHDPGLLVGRIQNFANWSPEMVPDSELRCYGMEYFCSIGDSLWSRTDADLITLATDELIRLGLSMPGDVVDGYVVRQPKAYPVYDDSYKQNKEIIRAALGEHCPGLHVVGRNGMHQYNNQDHSMMTAMLTARNIIAGNDNLDVWCVTQDAEYIEEKVEEEPSRSDSPTVVS